MTDESPNPYASPEAASERRVPWEVAVYVASLTVVTAILWLQVAGDFASRGSARPIHFLGSVAALAALVGAPFRSGRALLAGRAVGQLAALMVLFSLVLFAAGQRGFLAVVAPVVFGVPLLGLSEPRAIVVVAAGVLVFGGLAYWAGGRRGVLSYFGLVCPSCGSEQADFKSIASRWIKCRKCHHEWRNHEQCEQPPAPQ